MKHSIWRMWILCIVLQIVFYVHPERLNETVFP